jgi:hypothetical protein
MYLFICLFIYLFVDLCIYLLVYLLSVSFFVYLWIYFTTHRTLLTRKSYEYSASWDGRCAATSLRRSQPRGKYRFLSSARLRSTCFLFCTLTSRSLSVRLGSTYSRPIGFNSSYTVRGDRACQCKRGSHSTGSTR